EKVATTMHRPITFRTRASRNLTSPARWVSKMIDEDLKSTQARSTLRLEFSALRTRAISVTLKSQSKAGDPGTLKTLPLTSAILNKGHIITCLSSAPTSTSRGLVG